MSDTFRTIDAWLVLPDHLDAVWTLPPGDDDFPTRWRLIKTFFARGLPHTVALVACARKLLVFANTVVARGTPWSERTAAA